MKKSELLNLARQGKEAWNAWSSNHLNVIILLDHVNFQQYAEIIDFSGFVFPPISFDGSTFPSGTRFDEAEFSGWASFNKVKFTDNVSFQKAKFHSEAILDAVTFTGRTQFGSVEFEGDVNFSGVSFDGDVEFDETIFGGDVRFSESRFRESAYFNKATFNGVTFSEARFNGPTVFSAASFSQRAVFKSANFLHGAKFNEARFRGAANFVNCVTTGNLIFTDTVFEYPPFLDGIDSENRIVDLVKSGSSVETNVDANTRSLISGRLPLIRPALRLTAASVSAQLNEFRERVRSDNYLRAEDEEYHENLLNMLDKFAVELEILPDIVSESEGPASEDEIEATANWYQRFLFSSAIEFDKYTSPEAMAKMAIPTGLILSVGTLGALIGPMVGVGTLGGFGAGSFLAKLALGHAKPSELAEKIEKKLHDDAPSETDK